MGAAVQLIDDLEYGLLPLPRRRVLGQERAKAQMRFGTQFLGDQRIGRLLHAVVEKAVPVVRAEDQASANRLPQVIVQFLDRFLTDHPQHVELGAVSQASKLAQRLQRCHWQAIQFSDHQLHDVVGVALGMDEAQIP